MSKYLKIWSAYIANSAWYVWDAQGCEIFIGRRAKTKANKLANYLNKHQINGRFCFLDDVCKQFTKETGVKL